MLAYRLKAYATYRQLAMQYFGPDLSDLDLEHMLYYSKESDRTVRDWEDVPDTIQKTFDRLGVPTAERKYSAGASATYESEVVYHNMRDEFEKLGIIYLDMDTALKEYPELVLEYFGKLVKQCEQQFAARLGAVWSGGSFIVVQ